MSEAPLAGNRCSRVPTVNQSDVLSTNYLPWIVYQTQSLKSLLPFLCESLCESPCDSYVQRVHMGYFMYVCVGRWHLWLTLRVRLVNTDISNIQSTLTADATGRRVRRAGGRRKWWRARRVNAEKEHTLLLYEMQLQFSVMVQCTSNKFWLLNEGNAMGFYTPLYLCVVFTQKEVGQRSFTFSLNWREKSY